MRGVSFLKCLAVLTLLSVVLAFAPTTDPEGPRFDEKDTAAIIKASYIYNFAKMIDWPDHLKKGNFIIGVMGSSSMYQQLVTKYNGKTIGSQPIEIRKISNTQNFTTCHILFVDNEFSSSLDDVISYVNGTSTLLISHHKGALTKGVAINFIVVDDNLKFELSVPNAERNNLFVGMSLKGLALHVEN